MKDENSQKDVGTLRRLCPDCKKYFKVKRNVKGEITGKCPNCNSFYLEFKRKNTKFIKTVQKQKS